MYEYYNPNPQGHHVGDCTVRALCKALDKDWESIYAALTFYGFKLADMPSANHVWGAYLRDQGFKRYIIDEDLYTVEKFCKDFPEGTYILAIQEHVVCVVDGVYYDSWDSGNAIPLYVWGKDGKASTMEQNNPRGVH